MFLHLFLLTTHAAHRFPFESVLNLSIKFNLPHFSLTPVTDNFRAVVHACTFIDVSERTDRSFKNERKQDLGLRVKF